MGALTDALTAALVGAGESVDEDEDDVFDTELSNEALARLIVELDPGAKLPAKGTDRRAEYARTLRSIQRYRKAPGTGQTRGRSRPRADFLDRVKRAPAKRRAAISGVDMTWRAWVRVSQTWKVHTMPAGGTLSVSLGDELLDRWAAGHDVDDELAASFLAAYELPQADWRDTEWATMDTSG